MKNAWLNHNGLSIFASIPISSFILVFLILHLLQFHQTVLYHQVDRNMVNFHHALQVFYYYE